ncbi:MAG: metallophosphoesterase [Acidimicrobiales bacterium]
MTPGPFDVIGDVHGHADRLRGLLAALGYRRRGGAWRHPQRRAFFVGDLIDRGPQQLETVALVRAMVDAGSAFIVLGNHELNAIAWATRHPDRPGEHLRARHGAKGARHFRTHERFLTEVGPDSARHRELVAWFRTLPLWCDLGSVRVVHACWDAAAIDELAPRLGPGATLTDAVLVGACTAGHPDHAAVEVLLKGPELTLPGGAAYLDKEGTERTEARFAWWDPTAVTYRRAALIPADARTPAGTPLAPLGDDPVPLLPAMPYRDPVPLFVGHYWRTGVPGPLGPQVACVDYSAGRGGPLVAYRWDGEPVLDPDRFVAFGG